jgi:hypothetical protein
MGVAALTTILPILFQYYYSASSLNQQFADSHVAPLGHIILIPIQQVFVLFP